MEDEIIGMTREEVAGSILEVGLDPDVIKQKEKFSVSSAFRKREINTEMGRVMEKELKNGEMFYRGAHSLEMFKNPLEEKFGRRPDDFFEAGLSIGGVKVNYGGGGLTFQALPRIPVLCILWAGDDEFPARVNILFDPTIEHHLALDTIWGLVMVITFKLLEF